MNFPRYALGVLLAVTASSHATAVAEFPTGLTGVWYEPATSGQGFSIDVLSASRLLVEFGGYTDHGERLGLLGDYEANGGPVFDVPLTVRLYQAKGRGFASFDPVNVSREWWGKATLTFHDCSHASVTITGSDGSQTLQLVQLTRPAGLICND